MAERKKGGKKGMGGKAFRNLADELGLSGSFDQLVRKAVVQGWDEDQFAAALMSSKRFRRRYPGLIEWKTGLPFGDFSQKGGWAGLLEAVTNYRTGLDDAQALAERVGIKSINRRTFAALVRNDISLDEFGTRLLAIKTVRENPGLMELYNEQRKFLGMKPLDKKGMMRFAAKELGPEFYDVYQAAYLRNAGLDMSAAEANKVAGAIDSPLGAPTLDLGKLVSEINRIKPDIGPELAREGIRDADLALLAAGQDPNNLAPKLEQLVAQRRVSGQVARGSSARQTDTGGIALFPEDEALSY